jgi:hypothetical protein
MLGDVQDVLVALCRSRFGATAWHCRGARQHDHGGIRSMLGDGLVHPVLIVGAVSREGCDRVGDLIEQRTGQRGVINLFSGQLNGDDLATLAFSSSPCKK